VFTEGWLFQNKRFEASKSGQTLLTRWRSAKYQTTLRI
jgi:hypothetical protein